MTNHQVNEEAGVSTISHTSKHLTKIAQVTTEPSEMKAVAEHGSDTALRKLAKNPNATSEVLVTARNRTSHVPTMSALSLHPNFPVEELDGEGMQAVFLKDRNLLKELMKSDSVTDKQAELVAAKYSYYGAESILKNPENAVTSRMIVELGEMNGYLLGLAVKNHKYPAIDRVSSLNLEYLPIVGLHTDDEEVVRSVLDSIPVSRDRLSLVQRILANKAVPADALEKIEDEDCGEYIDALIYHHPNVTVELKNKLLAKRPNAYI